MYKYTHKFHVYKLEICIAEKKFDNQIYDQYGKRVGLCIGKLHIQWR